ncbi:MAG TPA: SgcJ/EcaC family oxidoreductase [Nevskiaceae bacterium]|nr:SgcJ/EcaC family oxidoreductase [Nevskiaceae bacterium]
MRTLFAAALGLALLPASLSAETLPVRYEAVAAAPASAEEREIAALFDRWNAALATGNPDAVAALYAPNAVLLPTVSNEVRDTPEKIRAYFVKFLQAKPQGTINYRQVRRLDDNTALDAGVYTFELVKDGRKQTVQARYNYLYEKVGGRWLIVNHHSSAMPEPVGQVTASR